MRSTFPTSALARFVRGVALVFAAAAFAAPLRAQPAHTTVEVIGDSQAQGLAGALQRLFLRDPKIRVLDRARVSTGLAYRAGYDWPRAANRLAAEHNVGIVIVMFGANDRPPIRRNGVIDPTLQAQFETVYADRVRQIIRSFKEAGTEVIWVGHPIVRDDAYNEDMAFLNRIFATVAAAEGAQWVPTWALFAAADGGYSAYGTGIDGMTQRLRADDGVHLTPAGYDVVAARIEPLIVARQAALTAGPAATQ
jgi:uncharacterized protein